jgi:hypothetical protein
MSDRDRGYLHLDLYRCPGNRREAARVLAGYELTAEGGRRGITTTEAYTNEEIAPGAATEIGGRLIEAAPRCSFVMWEEPEFGGLGDLVAYTPRLGRFDGECTEGGCVMLDWDRVHSILAGLPPSLARAGVREPYRAEHYLTGTALIQATLDVAFAQPWITDWQYASGGEATPRNVAWETILAEVRRRERQDG